MPSMAPLSGGGGNKDGNGSGKGRGSMVPFGGHFGRPESPSSGGQKRKVPTWPSETRVPKCDL